MNREEERKKRIFVQKTYDYLKSKGIEDIDCPICKKGKCKVAGNWEDYYKMKGIRLDMLEESSRCINMFLLKCVHCEYLLFFNQGFADV